MDGLASLRGAPYHPGMRRLALRNGRFGLLSSITVFVIALYVLSIGPACRLARHGMVSVPQLAEIYRPTLALDSHLPSALQSVLTTLAELCGGGEKLNAARDEPVWCQYDISDFTCWYRPRGRRPAMPDERMRDRHRSDELDVSEVMSMSIMCIEAESWDEVGGRGQLIPEQNSQTLRICQPRRIQAAIERYINELRQIRRENLPDHDLDLISLTRIHGVTGFTFLWELKSHALIIDRNRDGRWKFDGEPVPDGEGLFALLDAQPRAVFEMGIYVPLNDDFLPAADHDRLVTFCREKDIDLFIFDREAYEKPLFGTRLGTAVWEVRRANSIYALRIASAAR